jgi:hypothetical protein
MYRTITTITLLVVSLFAISAFLFSLVGWVVATAFLFSVIILGFALPLAITLSVLKRSH